MQRKLTHDMKVGQVCGTHTKQFVQDGKGRPARFANRLVAPGKGEGAEVGHPFRMRWRDGKKLTAPDRSVCPVSRTVPGHPENIIIPLDLQFQGIPVPLKL